MTAPQLTKSAPGRKANVVVACLLACLGTVALDALLFRTNLYPSILKPESSTGLFEMILRRERQAQINGGDDMVVMLGNSRLGFSPKVWDQQRSKRSYHIRMAGVAGSSPRAWYYMLRDLDPTRRRYRAVVLAVDDYDDEDRAYNPSNDIRDLHYVIVRLRLNDILDFARSFDDGQVEWQAFRGGILKGIVLQEDIRSILTNPTARIAHVRLSNRNYAMWSYDYEETTASMTGLSIDWSSLAVTLPAGADEDQRATVNTFLVYPPDPQTGRLAAFRRTWFGRIIDFYRGSGTKIIFVRLPRGPIAPPDGRLQKLSSSIREFATQPDVALADEHAFDTLERPELFRDAMHLNREGIARFSVMLAEEISRILGPSKAAAVHWPANAI